MDLVVSTYENPTALDAILRRLKQGSLLPERLHVADDGSGRRTRELLQQTASDFPRPLLHHWHKDLGFRKCRILNEALASCQAEYVIFLDGDCLPHRHFVRDHARLAEPEHFTQGRRCFVNEEVVVDILEGKLDLLGAFLRGKLSGLFKAIRWPRPIIRRNREQRGLIGCNWAAWRQDLEAINGFDEEYEGWGLGEDSDVCSRLYNLGKTRKFVYGRALVYHLNHPEAEKSHLETSHHRLKQTVERGKVRCERGLDLHAAESKSSPKTS